MATRCMTKSLALLIAAGAMAGAASAQPIYPDRPIRIVIGFGPGGLADITMRLLGQKLTERTGQQVTIENRPGAGGVVAAGAVTSAQRRAAAGTAEPSQMGPPRAYGLVAAAFVVIAAYVALLPLIGFRIATALFVAAFQMALERPTTPRQWAMLAAIAVGTSVLTHLVFETYLLVLLPRGTWTGW